MNSVCMHTLQWMFYYSTGFALVYKEQFCVSIHTPVISGKFPTIAVSCFLSLKSVQLPGSNHSSNIQALQGCGEWPGRHTWLHKEANPFLCEQGEKLAVHGTQPQCSVPVDETSLKQAAITDRKSFIFPFTRTFKLPF